jgi:hypothetical protein
MSDRTVTKGTVNILEWDGKIVIVIGREDGSYIEAKMEPSEFSSCLVGVQTADALIEVIG